MSNSNQTFRGSVQLANSGTRELFTADIVTTPTVEQTIITHTVPVNTKQVLLSVRATCNQPLHWYLEVDGDKKGSGRLQAGSPNDDYYFDPYEEVDAGSIINLKILSRGVASKVEAYLQTRTV